MTARSEKITDILKQKRFTYSFELVPPRTQYGIYEFDSEMYAVDCEPVFFAVTWHAKLQEAGNLDIAPLRAQAFSQGEKYHTLTVKENIVRKPECLSYSHTSALEIVESWLAKRLRSEGKNVLVHLSCDLLTMPFLSEVIQFLKENGICNLLVVLGENFSSTESLFKYAGSLIHYIRQVSGDYFCIGVAGFPDASHEELLHLKEKINNGADFVITQAFFEPQTFLKFRKKCEKLDIKVPIIPGIYLFETAQQLKGFSDKCNVKVTSEVLKRAEEPGFSGTKMIAELIQDISSGAEGMNVHFFTLNGLEFVNNFVKKLKKTGNATTSADTST